MVEDPFRHDCQSVGDLRRAVDHLQEFIAGRTTPLSRRVLLRVKLDPLKAGPAGRARHVICCHRQYEAQRTRSVPRHHDNDGGRCIPSGAINVESPGRRPGLSFGADGFRAVRLRVTEPASAGAGRLQGIGRRHTEGDTLDDVRRPSSQRTNKSGADQKSAQTYDNHDSITQPKVYDNGLWPEDVVSAGARDADHAGFVRAIPRAGMRSCANGALTHPWAGSDTGASEVRRFICRPSYGACTPRDAEPDGRPPLARGCASASKSCACTHDEPNKSRRGDGTSFLSGEPRNVRSTHACRSW